jgi:anion-transporting  ArsA/GET3 family ATPase
MNQLKINQIRDELMKIKDFDSLKKEVKKLIAEIEKFDFKKAIPEDKIEYVEKKYKEIMKTINNVQSTVEKEVDKTMKMVSSRKEEAFQVLKEIQKQAFKQKKDLETLLHSNFSYFAKKAQETLKSEEKNIKKTVRKVRKTAVAKAKKTLSKTRKKK